MKNEISRFGFTEFEKNAFKRRRSNQTDLAVTVILSVTVLVVLALILYGALELLNPATTFAQVPDDSFCGRARIDAVDLRSQHIPDNYGENLIKLCGELN